MTSHISAEALSREEGANGDRVICLAKNWLRTAGRQRTEIDQGVGAQGAGNAYWRREVGGVGPALNPRVR